MQITHTDKVGGAIHQSFIIRISDFPLSGRRHFGPVTGRGHHSHELMRQSFPFHGSFLLGVRLVEINFPFNLARYPECISALVHRCIATMVHLVLPVLCANDRSQWVWQLGQWPSATSGASPRHSQIPMMCLSAIHG